MIAVIGALEFQNIVVACKGARHAHGVLGRLGPGGGEGNFIGARDRVDQFRGELDRQLVQRTEEMQALGDLFLGRRDHIGVGMTQDQRAGAADIIDIPFPAHILETRAFALVDHETHVVGQGIAAQPAARQACRRDLVIFIMAHSAWGAGTGMLIRIADHNIGWCHGKFR